MSKNDDTRIVLKPGGILVVLILVAIPVYTLIRPMLGGAASQNAGKPTYFALDEGKGTTTASATDRAITGTLQGNAGWAKGLVGASSLNLPGGTGGYIEIPRPLVDTSKSYTVAACVRLNEVGGFQTVVGVDGKQVSGFFLQLRDDTKKFTLAVLPGDDYQNNNPVKATAKESAIAGRWYHVAGVFDAQKKTIALYVDGVLQETTPCTTSWAATGQTTIGRGFFQMNKVDFVNGQIDDVRFYQTALSADTIGPMAKTALNIAAASTPK